MRIIKHFNPHFPERETYKCTIRYTTQYGTLEESNTKAAGVFYQTLTYKGD